MKKGWANANPVAAVDRPREAETDADIRFLTHEEVEALLRNVTDEEFAGDRLPTRPHRLHLRPSPRRAGSAPLARCRLGRRRR
jgi:hypothetical protein